MQEVHYEQISGESMSVYWLARIILFLNSISLIENYVILNSTECLLHLYHPLFNIDVTMLVKHFKHFIPVFIAKFRIPQCVFFVKYIILFYKSFFLFNMVLQ